MEQWKKRMAEIMEMDDPCKAMVEIARLVVKEQLPLEILETAPEEYAAKNKVDVNEMAFYPNGERVVSLETFLGLLK